MTTAHGSLDPAALIALGAPLSGGADDSLVCDAATLRRHVLAALEQDARDPFPDARLRDALHALVVAVGQHFPALAAEWRDACPEARAVLDAPVPGRVVKLARIATTRLAAYL